MTHFEAARLLVRCSSVLVRDDRCCCSSARPSPYRGDEQRDEQRGAKDGEMLVQGHRRSEHRRSEPGTRPERRERREGNSARKRPATARLGRRAVRCRVTGCRIRIESAVFGGDWSGFGQPGAPNAAAAAHRRSQRRRSVVERAGLVRHHRDSNAVHGGTRLRRHGKAPSRRFRVVPHHRCGRGRIASPRGAFR
jgi:hypothetical protein